MTLLTADSFPGTRDEASRTVSPAAMRMGWSRLAMRESAAIGSPCDPVQMRTTDSGGSSSTSRESTSSPGGTFR